MACAIALLNLLLTFPAFANLTTSALTGRVTVGKGPLAGVTVTATSTALQQPRTTLTGPRGTYFLDALPPGPYEVTFSLAGHSSLTRRVTVELARVGRADAKLEPSEDEESVTSTVRTPSVGDNTVISTHFDDRMLDRLPIRRDAHSAGAVSPASGFSQGTLDDLPYVSASVFGQDALEQATVLHDGLPVQYERSNRSTVVARTRSGGEKLFLSLRENLTSNGWIDNDPYADVLRREGSGVEHRLELNVGGAIVSEQLWFFAAGWAGDEADLQHNDQRGLTVKLTSQLGAQHNVVATHNDADSHEFASFDLSVTGTSLHYTGVYGPRFTTELAASRSDTTVVPFGPDRFRDDIVRSKSSYLLPTASGDHLLSAGGSTWDDPNSETWSLFASDRWAVERWTVYAGLRYERSNFADVTIPRISVTYDLRGNGRHALGASFGDYADARAPGRTLRQSSLGYLAAIGTSGNARIHLVRRDSGTFTIDEVQVEARYRLFDRFEFGGNYTYAHLETANVAAAPPEHVGNAWVSLELPIGEHEMGVTVLQRYRELGSTALPTDIALRYTIPFPRFRLTTAADVTNAFAHDKLPDSIPRALRLWVRVRM